MTYYFEDPPLYFVVLTFIRNSILSYGAYMKIEYEEEKDSIVGLAILTGTQ